MATKEGKPKQLAEKKPSKKVPVTKVSDLMKKISEEEDIPNRDWRKIPLKQPNPQ